MTIETGSELVTVSFADYNFDLHNEGEVDQRRHMRKVRQAIKDNLPEIVGNENIINSDGKTIINVPIKGLELPRFRYGDNKVHEGVGQGEGEIGEVIGQIPTKEPGKGKQAGDVPGVDYYEVGVTADYLAELMYEDLGLPWLVEKSADEIDSEAVKFTDIRRKGPMSNLDKKRSLLENLRRNAMVGDPKVRGFSDRDLRFKTWEPEVKKTTNAAIIAMRDVSGSMGEFEKYISRSMYFWMARFMRMKYQKVKMVFITHTTEAKEVDEEAFFNLGESGGTKVSSAYQKALNIIGERFDPERWNIYPFHFSDGDNWGENDNKLCGELVGKLLVVCNMFGYGEIGPINRQGTLYGALQKHVSDPHYRSARISKKEDVPPALQTYFREEIGKAA